MLAYITVTSLVAFLIFYLFGRGIGFRGIFQWTKDEMHRFFIPRVVYLDHNATTPLHPAVKKEMNKVLGATFGNASSLHTHGRGARGIVENARKTIAVCLNCESYQIFFTSGGTEANNTVIKGVFASCPRPASKKHIITAKIEHESIIGACEQVEDMGGKVTYLSTDKNGRVSVESVANAIQEDTILISIMYANNETGILQPIKEISAVAKRAGIPFHSDCVQAFGKISVDVKDIDCEFMSISAHKINGPKGIGALYSKGSIAFYPLIYGGQQEREFRAGTEGIDYPYNSNYYTDKTHEKGVHNIAGFGKAAEIRAANREKELNEQRTLRLHFLKRLRSVYPTVRVNEAVDPANQLPGTLNLTFPGQEGIRLLAGLDCYEISVSIGSACTAEKIEPSHVLLGMGLSERDALSSIRISMGSTTTAKDLQYTTQVLSVILEGSTEGFEFLDPHLLTQKEIESDTNFLIDVRFPIERVISPSMPGAAEWSHVGFDQHFNEIPKNKRVILMCRTGVMSFSAGYRLAKLGKHSNVRVIFGGYQAWLALHPGLLERMLKRDN